MITIEELNSFEEYIRSGRLEKDFQNSGEYGRGEILELLEKIMDLADLANEAATRIIFRGIPTGSINNSSGNS